MFRRSPCNHSAGIVVLAGAILGTGSVQAARLAVLSPQNWEQLAPRGKEADAIYGDFVLRNDRLVAVVAFPSPGRNANLGAKKAGAVLIDLTNIEAQSDQLTAFYPGSTNWENRPEFHYQGVFRDGLPVSDGQLKGGNGIQGKRVALRFIATDGQVLTELTYTVEQGKSFVLVESVHRNTGATPVELKLTDRLHIA